jgi:hypothetical protein
MSFRRVALVPVALALIMIAVAAFVPDHPTQILVLRRAVQGGKLLAAGGALAAALAFGQGDYLRRAWGLQAIGMLLLLRDLPLERVPLGGSAFGVSRDAWNTGAVTIANVAGVAGAWMMARAWRVAGIELPYSPAFRRAVYAAGLLAAVVIAGVPLVRNLVSWADGTPPTLPFIVSAVADALTLALIAPVLMTVLAMRGGLLVWPWGLYMAGLLCWMVYDTGEAAVRLEALQHAAPAIRLVKDSFRLLACTLICAAGIAQRGAVLSIRAPSPGDQP